VLFDELKKRREEILAIARQCGLTNIKVFGSVARGEERPDSDIDFLVTSDPNSPHKGLDVFGFPVEMEELLGRKVDMVFEKGLYHVIRDDVLSEAKPL
jgi:predicted nucleotidyltransferase